MYRCDEPGAGFGTDCARFGLVCREEGTFTGCVEPLPSKTCDTPGEAKCDGAKLHYCGPGGILFEHDCRDAGDLECTLGGGVQEQDSPWLDCVPHACGIRFDVSDKCDGDDILLDMGQGNAVTRLHCPTYGFATCKDRVCAN